MSILHDPRALRAIDDTPLSPAGPADAYTVIRHKGAERGYWVATRGSNGRFWYGSRSLAEADARAFNREVEVDADAPTEADLAEYGRWLAETSPDHHTDEPTPVEVVEDTRDHGDDAQWWRTADFDPEMDSVRWALTDEREAEATAQLDAMAEGTLEPKPERVGDDDMPHYSGSFWHSPFRV